MKLLCWYCQKPITNELPDNIIFRGIGICPECLEKVPEEIDKLYNDSIKNKL